MHKNIILLFLTILINSPVFADPPSPFVAIPTQAGHQGLVYEAKIGVEKFKLPFALFLPKGYEVDKNRKWPIIFYLHGGGECDSDFLLCICCKYLLFYAKKLNFNGGKFYGVMASINIFLNPFDLLVCF